jgi:hypothetical protein
MNLNRSIWAALFMLSFACLLSGQSEFGALVGTVTDPSDAPIPRAPVSIRSVETGVSLNLTTDSSGSYTSPPLRPGSYVLSVEVQGFRKASQTITLDVNQRARANFRMEVGQVTESVTIAAETPLLETQSAALGNVRTTKAINDLPLNGRNFVQLFHVAAGVIPVGGSPVLGPSASNQIGIAGGSVNGGRISNNDFRFDGIQSQDTDQSVLVILPSPDAIQEFKVQTSAMDASFGRSGGATVNLILKSGTNQMHGTVFEFLRNSALDAKNFFDSPQGKTPPFRLNQFGGALGGPIVRNKTFFFGDYQGTRIRQAQTYLSSVPTDAFKGGNFSTLPLQIYDPATTRADPSNPTGLVRDPFPGNAIPPNRFNRTGGNLANLYPTPNLPGINNNLLYNPSRRATVDQFDGKVDHRFRDADSIFARYSFNNVKAYNPSFLPAPALGDGPSYPGNNDVRGQQAVLNYNHTFSPTRIYEGRIGFSRLYITNVGELSGTNISDKVGIPGINVDPRFSGLGEISVSGFRGLGEAGFLPLLKVTNNYQYSNQFIWIAGKHSLRFGYELLRRQMNQGSAADPQGTFSFNGQFTQNPARAAGTGSGMADMLLGVLNSSRLDIEPIFGHRRWEHSWYFADDLRLTSRLTLNLGARYEITTPWTEVADRMGSLVPEKGFVYAVNTPELPGHTVMDTDFSNVAPRAGISYSLTRKTVIRSGYGIFYSFPGIASGRLPSKSPPRAGNIAINNNTFATDLGTVKLISDGFPTARPTVFDPTGNNFKYSPRHDQDAYLQQWNINIQQALGFDTVVTAAYVGSHGSHLYIFPNINQPIPGSAPINARRPFPRLASADGVHRAADSIYHSFQLTGEKRFSRGLSFLAAYTYSHAIDNGGTDTGGGPQDPRSLRADRGNADFDVRQRMVLSWNYELPFGAGRKYLSGLRGIGQQILGGWQINGIDTFMSGQKFSPSSAQNTLGAGAGGQRPDRIRDGNLPSGERTLQRWFDISAFRTPQPFLFGNAARNILDGPGTKQVDLSVFKQFRPGKSEARRLEYRAEFFNLFNTPQFNTPGASIGSTTAGQISSAGEPVFFQRTSRQIQMALKLYF